MTYLGNANLFGRLGRAILGWLHPPRPASAPPRDLWVIGHRGVAKLAAENTIESFSQAVELGADGVEADICVTRDGRFVVWHDIAPDASVALARQIGGEGYLYVPSVPLLGSRLRRPVAELDFADFREHFGYVLREKGLASPLDGERRPDVPPVPLEDLLDWAEVESRLSHVVFDVKLEPGQSEQAVRLFRLLGERSSRPAFRSGLNLHYLSPHREIVAALVAGSRRTPPPPSLRLHGDFELPGVLRFARRFGLKHISMGCGRRTWDDFRGELGKVVRWREGGRIESVVVWTFNEEEKLRDLAGLGVDGVITDEPELLRNILKRRATTHA